MGRHKFTSALPAVALFLLGLTINSFHWLTLPLRPGFDGSSHGLYAHDLLNENLFSFYVYHQFGPHPLIIYLQAIAFAIFGLSAAAMESTTIVAGALAVPAIYWASIWLFEDNGTTFSRRAGLITAMGFALSSFIAAHSRIGTEPVLMLAVELMAVALLWRGFQRGRWTDFVLAGLLVGVSQYVYIVARFFPLALAVATLGAVLANRRLLAHWRRLLCAAASAALVALPQWTLFLVHPFTFTARVSNPVGPSGGQFILELPDPAAVFAAKLSNLLTLMAWHWDTWVNSQFSKSLLTPVLIAGLIVGVAVALIQRRDRFVFAILLMGMMLLPDLLTYEKGDTSAIDSNRILPAIPFIFILAGLGLAKTWQAIEGGRRIPTWAGYLIPALVLISGLLRQWDYATHARLQNLVSDSQTARLSKIAEYIGSHLDKPILLPANRFRKPPLAFSLSEHFGNRHGGWPETLQHGDEVVAVLTNPNRPMGGGFSDEWVLLSDRTVYFLPPLQDSIELLYGEEEAITVGNGVVVATAFPARWQGVPLPFIPLYARFENHLSFVGYKHSDFSPGSTLALTLFWQSELEVKRDVEIFVQLYDPARQVVLVNRQVWPLDGVFRVRAWHPGETMPMSFRFSIPEDLVPGSYHLNVGVLDLVARTRVPLLTGGDSLRVKSFKVPLPADNRVPENEVEVRFGDTIALDGYTFVSDSAGLKMALFWHALDTPQFDYKVFVHIVDSDDRIVAQLDAQPLDGSYPTSIWSPGEVIVDEHIVSPIPQGEYRVYIGWYRHLEDGWERLPIVSEGVSTAADRFLLGTITLS